MIVRRLLIAIGIGTFVVAAPNRISFAADAPATRATPGSSMDYGPFLAYSVSHDPGPKTKKMPEQVEIANKGLVIDVGNGAAVCFDTATCRMAAGWTGGLVDLSRTHMTSLKGWWDATPRGPIVFSTKPGPGWAKDGSFADPRPHAIGALPKDWAHYKGLYRHGRQVVLSYSVGEVAVLELPGCVKVGGKLAFTRTFHIDKSDAPLQLDLDDAEAGEIKAAWTAQSSMNGQPDGTGHGISVKHGTTSLMIASGSLPKGSELRSLDSRAVLTLPALSKPATFKIMFRERGNGEQQNMQEELEFFRQADQLEDLPALCKGGPALWNQKLETAGRLAPPGNKPYVVDSLTLPEDNPWHAWMRPTGLDFFPDGRCAICTFNGDVWIVSGLDQGLEHLTWKRFATGLYEPLGLKIVDGTIYVTGRDQITRLHDLDGDGEADFYENFNNDIPTYPAYHSFHFDLQTDSHGNFWTITCGNSVPSYVPMGGAVIKISKDGSKSEVVATGLRAANGCGMGPHDEFVCSDNQGNWTPVCRINLVKPGGFYGFNNTPALATKEDVAHERKTYDVPLCWIPYQYDNSTGGQVFVTGNKWGPLEGRMLSTSYGKSRLFEVLPDEVDGVIQGATVPLPFSFDSGIMRARFNPSDGQLYVCGIMGWETSGSRDGCLQRVRYTGRNVYLPSDFHVQKDAIAITFTCPLDPKTANDEQSFGVEQYNYKWSSKYGSGKYKVSDPTKVGIDEVEVKSAQLLPDGKTVVLSIPKLAPVMQMTIQVHLNAADGTAIECEVDATINHVPGSSAPPVLTAGH